MAAELRRVARTTSRPFKQVVNEALRAGLLRTSGESRVDISYPVQDLGVRAGVDLVRARQLAADLEDEAVLRKLELRK